MVYSCNAPVFNILHQELQLYHVHAMLLFQQCLQKVHGSKIPFLPYKIQMSNVKLI